MKLANLFPSGLTPSCLLKEPVESDSKAHSRTKELKVEHTSASPGGLAKHGLLSLTPRDSNSVGLKRSRKFAFLICFPVDDAPAGIGTTPRETLF